MLLLRNLKRLLRYDYPFIILISLVLIYVFVYINKEIIPTKYLGNETTINGYIDALKLDGNHLSITLIAKESVILNYYIDQYFEYQLIKANYQLGDYLEVRGQLVKPNGNTNFNLFNYQQYLLSKSIYWTFKVDRIINHQSNTFLNYQLKNGLNHYLEQYPSNNYLKALILGDTGEIEQDVNLSYQSNGISHLFAVSGMHITMLTMGFLFILKKIIKRTLISYGIVIVFLLFYMFLTNYTPSVIRASTFFTLVFINRTFNLHIKNNNLLLLILSILLLLNPYLIYSVGLQFTFVVCFYLNHFRPIIKRQTSYLKKTFVISAMAFLVGIPILMNTYFSINLLTPFINLLFVPLITLIIFPLSIIVLIIPWLSPVLIYLIKLIEYLSLLIYQYRLEVVLAKPPIYIIILYCLMITYCLYKVKIRQYQYLLLIATSLLIHSNITLFNRFPTLTMIDVGQGDSILVTLPYNQGNILFDTGGKTNFIKEKWKIGKEYSLATNTIIPYLKSIGISNLNYLVLTHGDFDHLGEAKILINNLTVNNVLLNSGNNNNLELALLKQLDAMKIPYKQISEYNLMINHYLFMFINKKNPKSENTDSLVTYTNLNNKNILLMGDADKTNEISIINKYQLPPIDVLKVGHHGSKYSTSNELIDQVIPKISLISVAKKNLYNHPDLATINMLKDSNVLMTSQNGMIKIIFKNSISIYSCLK